MGLKYPLLADFHPRGEVAKKYGLFAEDKGTTARATVIVDKSGKVAWVKEQERSQARDNRAILDVLAGLG
jgi:alkyl hydroperoxide reductase subunit AhpC